MKGRNNAVSVALVSPDEFDAVGVEASAAVGGVDDDGGLGSPAFLVGQEGAFLGFQVGSMAK
ncbi:hypothetical protein [Saccharothrix xinjiangensis]|uniref:Uncharacterized protein n=1 Tax=Saccharothrix xinjiangensis TaxID=204798 RepID=A0ABV9Y6F0_9PSEU